MTVTKDLEWKDISNESYRMYWFVKEGLLAPFTIEAPLQLNYNPKSGGHRVIDAKGMSWYIPSGWIALCWEGKEEGVAQYAF